MTAAARVWRNISLGVFCLAVAALLYLGHFWPWILVVLCGMAFLNSMLKGNWRWAVHPALWGCGIAYTIASPTVTKWPMFWALCGVSIIVGYLVSLVPRRVRPEAVPPRGARIVIDAETVERDRGPGSPTS